jgi:hypothetical protein
LSLWRVLPTNDAPDTVTYENVVTTGNGLIAGVATNEEILSSAYQLAGGDEYYDTNIKAYAEEQLELRTAISGTIEYDFNQA